MEPCFDAPLCPAGSGTSTACSIGRPGCRWVGRPAGGERFVLSSCDMLTCGRLHSPAVLCAVCRCEPSGACHAYGTMSVLSRVMLAEVNNPSCLAGTCRPCSRWLGGRLGGELPVLFALWCACLWALAQCSCVLPGVGHQHMPSGVQCVLTLPCDAGSGEPPIVSCRDLQSSRLQTDGRSSWWGASRPVCAVVCFAFGHLHNPAVSCLAWGTGICHWVHAMTFEMCPHSPMWLWQR